jgi:hypothetical protein
MWGRFVVGCLMGGFWFGWGEVGGGGWKEGSKVEESVTIEAMVGGWGLRLGLCWIGWVCMGLH